jgi:hypothetical protein
VLSSTLRRRIRPLLLPQAHPILPRHTLPRPPRPTMVCSPRHLVL